MNGVLQERRKPLDLDLSRTKRNFVSSHYERSLNEENNHQEQNLIDRSVEKVDEIRNILRKAVNRHLNFNQSFLINASETILFYKRLTSNELLNKTFRPTNDTLIHFHSNNTTSTNQQEHWHIESQLDALAPFGNGHSNTNYSRSLSLSLFDENGKEIVAKKISHEIELIIPRDPQMKVPPLIYENVSNHTESFRWKSINLRELQTNPNLSFSLHFQFFPVMNRTKIAYAFVYQFDQSPQFDRLDGSTLLCPSTINDEILSTYIDNQHI